MVYYHHTDHLGTTEVITDSNGKIVWHADYEAFGNIMNERGEENFTPNYTGKFFDESSGLYYFNARWYDCELGRFTTQDPARDGVNWWIYCGGNPITFVDPDGKFILNTNIWYNKKYMQDFNASWPNSNESIAKTGCTAVASLRGCNTIVNKYGFAMDTPVPISITEIRKEIGAIRNVLLINDKHEYAIFHESLKRYILGLEKLNKDKLIDDVINWLSKKDLYLHYQDTQDKLMVNLECIFHQKYIMLHLKTFLMLLS